MRFFLSGVQKSIPLLTCCFPTHCSLACMISGKTSSDLDAFPIHGREKGTLLCRESWFMCKLPVALYLLCPWRVHTQMKGSVGQGWVCAGFSRCRNDRVRDVVKDYQTGSDFLLLFTHGVAHKNKIRHTRGFCSVSAKHHHSCTVSLSSAFCIRSFAHLSRHGNALL